MSSLPPDIASPDTNPSISNESCDSPAAKEAALEATTLEQPQPEVGVESVDVAPAEPSAQAVVSALPPVASDSAGDLEDFGALLDSYAPPSERPERGQQIEGRITRIGAEHAFVDVGAKEEGVIELVELLDDKGVLKFAVGDTVRAVVMDEDSSAGGIRLSRRLSGEAADDDSMRDAFEAKVPVQGRVERAIKGGFEVKVGHRNAFCPISQIEVGRTEDPNVHVGKTYDFLITELGSKGRLVVSRAKLQSKARDEAKAALRDTIKPGAVLDGEVTRVREFGAFVDLGGLEGMVHVSELRWGHIDDPTQVVKPGDKVKVKVLRVEWGQNDRISLSMKAVETNPWETAAENYKIGENYEGTVVRLADFGAFVELEPGIDGLVHVSEMSWTQRVRRPSDVVKVGDQVQVQVLQLDKHARRLSLGMRQVLGNPWDTAVERFAPGTEVTGTVVSVQNFGVFVDLGSGITALLPASESASDRQVPMDRQFAEGESLSARVLEVNVEQQRLSLTRRDPAEIEASAAQRAEGIRRPPRSDGDRRPRPERSDSRGPRGDGRGDRGGDRGGRRDSSDSRSERPSSGAGLGTFADLLGDRLKGFGKGTK